MIHDKDSVVTLLERLERVCREVKGLPEFVKRGMALNVGCLVTDLDELEGLVEQGREHVESMSDIDDAPDLDISEGLHFEAIKNALCYMDSLDEDCQVEIFDIVLKESTCFDTDVERFNVSIKDAGKDWFVISTNERDTALEACKTLTTLLENE